MASWSLQNFLGDIWRGVGPTSWGYKYITGGAWWKRTASRPNGKSKPAIDKRWRRRIRIDQLNHLLIIDIQRWCNVRQYKQNIRNNNVIITIYISSYRGITWQSTFNTSVHFHYKRVINIFFFYIELLIYGIRIFLTLCSV